jgi:hypothetical protein
MINLLYFIVINMSNFIRSFLQTYFLQATALPWAPTWPCEHTRAPWRSGSPTTGMVAKAGPVRRPPTPAGRPDRAPERPGSIPSRHARWLQNIPNNSRYRLRGGQRTILYGVTLPTGHATLIFNRVRAPPPLIKGVFRHLKLFCLTL